MDDNTVMKPPSRSIRPPGAPTSIRPPRSGESFPTRHSFQSLRQPAPHSLWIFILVVALVIGIGTVVHLQDLADPSAPPNDHPSENAATRPSPTDSSQASSAPSAATATPQVTNDSWPEQWRIETGMEAPWDSNERWSFISNGSHIVIYENDIDRPTSARIYKLIDGQPILTIEVPPSTRTPAGINSTSLIYSRQFIDLETGAATDTGWDKTATPVYITDELIVACSPEPITCSAWDMNDGTPTQRWSQAYAGRLVHSWEIQHVGDTSSGYIKMPIDNTTHFVSLTDGTSHNSQSSSDHPEFIAAADGWIRIRSWKDNATLTPDGTPTGSFSTPTARSSAKAALLEGGFGTPKISELRRAYESEDISWANTSLVCTQDGGCRFNGKPVSLPGDSHCNFSRLTDGYVQNNWTVSPDGRFVIMKTRSHTKQSAACIVDIAQGKVTERRIAIAPRGDLIIAAEGTTLVGYSPDHQ